MLIIKFILIEHVFQHALCLKGSPCTQSQHRGKTHARVLEKNGEEFKCQIVTEKLSRFENELFLLFGIISFRYKLIA
jgi:hypothetical protein